MLAAERSLTHRVISNSTPPLRMTINSKPVLSPKFVVRDIPFLLARAVMERSPHVMLGGEGADDFAAQHSLEQVQPSSFFTERRWRELEKGLTKRGSVIPRRADGTRPGGPAGTNGGIVHSGGIGWRGGFGQRRESRGRDLHLYASEEPILFKQRIPLKMAGLAEYGNARMMIDPASRRSARKECQATEVV